MSREILFRGKRPDGEWIEGNCIIDRLKDTYIVNEKDFNAHLGVGRLVKVEPLTICQHTGLTDCNGVKIFENDICTVTREDGLFLIEWDEDTARFILDGEGVVIDFDNAYGSDCEVQGNKFDNPELLEGWTGEDD